MTEGDFCKSVELVVIPGRFADVYKGMVWDEQAWYVKHYVGEDEADRAVILSVNWDGFIH